MAGAEENAVDQREAWRSQLLQLRNQSVDTPPSAADQDEAPEGEEEEQAESLREEAMNAAEDEYLSSEEIQSELAVAQQKQKIVTMTDAARVKAQQQKRDALNPSKQATAGAIKILYMWMIPSFGLTIYPIIFLYLVRWPSKFLRRFIPELGGAWMSGAPIPRTMLKVGEGLALFLNLMFWGSIHFFALLMLFIILYVLYIIASATADLFGGIVDVFY